MFNLKSKLIIITVMFFTIAGFVLAGDIGNSTGHAWMEKLGWISFNGDGASVKYGVMVGEAALSGYAWSEKTGWINFDDSGSYYGVTNDGTGNLSGYAWSEKLGYISFDDASANNFYQVTLIDSVVERVVKSGTITLRTSTTLRTGTTLSPGRNEEGRSYFSGYAWAEMGGYINMDDPGNIYKPSTEQYFACGTTNITDIDGNSYPTVKMGTQCWMAQNLMVSQNADGSAVNGTGDVDTTPPAAYGDTDGGHDSADANWEPKEGYLYNWQDAMNGATASGSQGICPDGWHIPSHFEWTDLERYICETEGNGSCDTTFPKDFSTTGFLGINEGTELKNVTNVNGQVGDPNGDDGYDFSALLAGLRGMNGAFYSRGASSYFWSSSENFSDVWHRLLYLLNVKVSRGAIAKGSGLSVRCVQD